MNFSQALYNIDEHEGQVQVMLILTVSSTIDVVVTVFSVDWSAIGKNKYYTVILCM